jgi:hypothetical protein
MATNHGRPAREVGRPADHLHRWHAGSSVPSFVASKSFSRSVDVTKAHVMTLVGGASFNDGIFLVAVVVDRALKGSMVGERMNKCFGR